MAWTQRGLSFLPAITHEETDPETGEVRTLPGPFLRSAFNYNMDAASENTALVTPEPTRTQQHFKEETDINTIVERFGLTGELPNDVPVPQSGDFTEVVDYQTALNLVIAGRDAFEAMPANVRNRFGNNPATFMEFVHDPANAEEARKLGLLIPQAEKPSPIEVRVIPDPAAGSPAAK